MKKIRTVLLMLIAIVSLGLFVSCGSNTKVSVVEITEMRTRIGVTILVNDTNSDITTSSISARLYTTDDDESLVDTKSFDELEEEEQTEIFDGLDESTSYKLILRATVDGKSVTYYNEIVTTTLVGSSEENPIMITSTSDLLDMRYDNDAYYKISDNANLDFSNTDGSNTVISTIYDRTTQFEGHLDGNGKTISNVTINNSNPYLGLFGYLAYGSSITNLTLSNFEVISTKGNELYCGVLAGVNEGSISNVEVINSSIRHDGTGTSKQYLGGLVGVNTYKITDSSVINTTITSRSRQQSTVGGFVGTNGGIIHSAYPNAEIKGCMADTTIVNNFISVKVGIETEEYFQYTGGFVGESRIAITDSYSTSTITNMSSIMSGSLLGLYEVSIGGFAGRAINGCKLTNIASSTTINYSSSDIYEAYVGVLIGSCYDAIINNAYGLLAGENSVVVKSTAAEGSTIEYKKNFDMFGLVENTIMDENSNAVAKITNVGFGFIADGSISIDSEGDEGHLGITSTPSIGFDYSSFSEFVKNYLDTLFA